MRATFSRFNFFGLCFAPQSGKTFICFMYLYLFQVFLRPSFGACAPPSPDLTFYAYDFLRRVGRLSAIVFPSEDLSRHLRATLPEGESFFIYYVNTYLVLFCSVLFCSVLLYILWISLYGYRLRRYIKQPQNFFM